MAASNDITILQGKTLSLVLRWSGDPLVYKAITGITQTAPARLTVPAHVVPDGWAVAVTNVKGMTEINAVANAVRDRDYHQATVIDANTIEINDINAAGFKAYVSGGYIQYHTPVSITGAVARMSIKDKVGGTVLASTEATYTPLNVLSIAVDATAHTLTLTCSATATAAFTWKTGVYDLEVLVGTVVTALAYGKVTVTKEVTT